MNSGNITPNNARKAASVPFLLVLICFVLPFVEVSCQGHKMISLTGYQAAFGTEVSEPVSFGSQPKMEKIEGMPSLVVVLVSSVVAAALCFVNNIVAAISGGIGLVFLILAKSKIDGDAVNKGRGLLTVDYGFGFYATMVLLLVGCVLAMILHNRNPD